MQNSGLTLERLDDVNDDVEAILERLSAHGITHVAKERLCYELTYPHGTYRYSPSLGTVTGGLLGQPYSVLAFERFLTLDHGNYGSGSGDDEAVS